MTVEPSPLQPYSNAVSGAAQFLTHELEWPETMEVMWFDRSGLMKLADGRVVRLRLSTADGTMLRDGEYTSIFVEVVSPTLGRLDCQDFAFDDYLPTPLAYRTDGRTDYPSRGDRCFRVVRRGPGEGWAWYIARPKSTRPLTRAIALYVGLLAR